MTEKILSDRFREGHLPSVEPIILDLHRLVTLFIASPNLAELRTNLAGDPISWLQQYEDEEITRILINSAIIARIIDDRDELSLNHIDTKCGDLIENLTFPKVIVPLSLREACNKIIHAKKIHSDISESNEISYRNPILYLYGQKIGVDWKVKLNVMDYAIKYIENITM